MLGRAGIADPRPADEDRAYRRAAELREDLAVLARALDAQGGHRLARGLLATRSGGPRCSASTSRGWTSGSTARVHAEALAEVLRVGRRRADYLALDEAARAALLVRELTSPRPLVRARGGYVTGDGGSAGAVRRHGPAAG